MKRTLLSAVALTLIAGLAHAAAPKPAAKPGAASGVAVEYFEPSIRVQDDFFAHMNGKWLATAEIPADKSSWGAFHKLHDDTQPQLRAIIEGAASNPDKAVGSGPQQIGDFYASFMNEQKLEELNIRPLSATLDKIAAVKDKAELPALMAHLGTLGITLPYDFSIHQDAKDSTKYVADIVQGGLGLPDRDYYLKKDDKKLADALAGYEAHVAKTLALAGFTEAAAKAKTIVALETSIAQVQWSNVENRDPVKTYNKVDIAKLAELAPGHDIKAFLDKAGVSAKVNYVIVSQPSYLSGFAKLSAQTPLDTLKAHLQYHTVIAYAPFLSKALVEEQFNFYGSTLTGAKEQQPRWKRGVTAVEAALGESIGKQYVQAHFPAERKARMEKLVANLLLAYKQSINKLDWMSPATKREAQAKLAKFTPKIGYPNQWKDYSKLTVAADDLVGNVMRSRALEAERGVAKLGKKIDRDEWFMTPQTINAYYNPEMNEIVFPAAILQPPFFDANADDAVNYGAIGAVIGHEISHGFDDQGAQYDGDGNLRDWWSAADHKNFKVKTSALVKQYGAYSPLPGYQVNGELTLGENIADNSGVAIAYKAYKLSLKGKKAPVIDGLTGDQRFFMGFGQVWREKKREAAQIVQVKTDPHSPGMFRANGTMKNQPAFYDAFGVKPGDKMYIAPKERVTIW
ncbi:MAG: M13-type metalloendopeptidase [Pseudomonadota bacterium]